MRNGTVAAFVGLLFLLPSPVVRAGESRVVVVVVGGSDDRRAGEAQREVEGGLSKNPSVRAALLPSADLPTAALQSASPAAPGDDAFQKAIDLAKQAYFDDKLEEAAKHLEEAGHALNAEAAGAGRDRWLLELWYVAISIGQSKNQDAETHAAAAAALSNGAVPADVFPPAVASLVAAKKAALPRVTVKLAVSPARLATIAIDDGAPVPAVQLPSVSLLAGRHWLRVAAPGYRGYTTDFNVQPNSPIPPPELWLAPAIEPSLAQKAGEFVRGENDGDAAAFGSFARFLAPEVAEVVFATPTASGWQARVWRVEGEAWEATPRLPELGHEVLAALPHAAPPVAVGGGSEPGGGATTHAAAAPAASDVAVGVFGGGRSRQVTGLGSQRIKLSTGGVQLGWDGGFGGVGVRARAQIAELGLFGDTTKITDRTTGSTLLLSRQTAPYYRVAVDGTWSFGPGFAGARLGYEALAHDAAPASYDDSSSVSHPANVFPKYTLLQAGPTAGFAIPAGPGRLRADAAILFGSYSEGGNRTSTTQSSAMATEVQLGVEGAFPVGDGGWTVLAGVNGGYRRVSFGGSSDVMPDANPGNTAKPTIREMLGGGGVALSRRF